MTFLSCLLHLVSQHSPLHMIHGLTLMSLVGVKFTSPLFQHTALPFLIQLRGLDRLDVTAMGDVPAVHPPSDTKRRRMERSSSRSRASSVAGEPTTSSPNN